jgi:hypothetical protein
MINGEKSSTPFRVSRVVRQGDPLSCLLFDLAIEPLAESLRQSDLKGLKIEGIQEMIIATLFADDMLVTLFIKLSLSEAFKLRFWQVSSDSVEDQF